MALLRATSAAASWHIRSALIRANSPRRARTSMRAREVVVDAETECFVCGRRIGNAAHVARERHLCAHRRHAASSHSI